MCRLWEWLEMLRPTPLGTAKRDIPHYTALDIETRRDGSVLAIGLIWKPRHGEPEYITFASWGTFTGWLRTNSRKHPSLRRIYAHNGGGFDWLSLVSYLLHTWPIGITVCRTGSTALIITLQFGKHLPKIRLLDSYRIIPVGLKEASEKLAGDKAKLDIHGVHPEDLLQSDPYAFWAYLERDCRSLAASLQALHRTLNDNIPVRGLGLTVASTALSVYTTHYLPVTIMTPRDAWQKALARRAYSGGRCEAIQTGRYDMVHGYDVNSLYPSVMAVISLPTSYVGYRTRRYHNAVGLYEVVYTQPSDQPHPLLRDEASGEFRYSGSGVYTHLELETLLTLGGKIYCTSGYVFRDHGVLFANYVLDLYAMRMRAKADGNTALDMICKLLLNSLYGKFGEREIGRELRVMSTQAKLEAMRAGEHITDYGDVVEIERKHEVNHEFVAISAYITAAGRLRLYSLLAQAGRSAVYCDTDSVYTTSTLPDNMVSNDLGALKLEYNGPMAIWGRKAYAKLTEAGPKARIKGIPRSAVADISMQDIATLLSGGDRTFAYSSPATMMEVLTDGRPPCVWLPRSRTTRLLTPGRLGHSA